MLIEHRNLNFPSEVGVFSSKPEKGAQAARARSIMVQGVASGVGKSVLVAALCRIYARRGFRVSPFKAQNMALNSFVTKTGGEIGRSTAVQAMAAGVEPMTAMNPILLKPKADITSQLIVMGEPVGDVRADEYFGAHKNFIRSKMNIVRRAWQEIASQFDVVVIEGAGSPAEINLRRQDVVNMRAAKMADAPVILVADIDKGGAFASLMGTYSLLTSSERRRIKAFVLNKFWGDQSLLGDAKEAITKKTGVPFIGVIPYKHQMGIQEEDAVPARVQGASKPDIKIGVVYLRHISNFTDLDTLAWEPNTQLIYATDPTELEGVDAIVIPGSKNTTGDLKQLRKSGVADAIKSAASRGTPIVGICGGYQMLGASLEDKSRSESLDGSADGLGLLPIKTYFGKKKILRQSSFRLAGATPFLSDSDVTLDGYEIHHGRSKPLAGAAPALIGSDGEPEGCVSRDGKIFGCYLHDLFESDSFRRDFINTLRTLKKLPPINAPLINTKAYREKYFDEWADLVSANIDLDALDKLLGLESAG